MPKTFNLVQKQKLVKKVKPFTLKKGIMYKVGQDNKMCRYLTTSEAQIVFKSYMKEWQKRTFFCKYSYKANFGCRILVANFIQGFMTFVEVVRIVQKLEDLKQKLWQSW